MKLFAIATAAAVLCASSADGQGPSNNGNDGLSSRNTPVLRREASSFADELFSEPAQRLLGEGCHCDGDHVHCNDAADEAACHCHDGSVHCVEEEEFDCHCDGNTPHCANEAHEEDCHCHEGSVHCESKTSSSSTDDDDGDSKLWGEIILASLLINITTLAGVLVLAGHWIRKAVFPNSKISKSTATLWGEILIPMFACVSCNGSRKRAGVCVRSCCVVAC